MFACRFSRLLAVFLVFQGAPRKKAKQPQSKNKSKTKHRTRKSTAKPKPTRMNRETRHRQIRFVEVVRLLAYFTNSLCVNSERPHLPLTRQAVAAVSASCIVCVCSTDVGSSGQCAEIRKGCSLNKAGELQVISRSLATGCKDQPSPGKPWKLLASRLLRRRKPPAVRRIQALRL